MTINNQEPPRKAEQSGQHPIDPTQTASLDDQLKTLSSLEESTFPGYQTWASPSAVPSSPETTQEQPAQKKSSLAIQIADLPSQPTVAPAPPVPPVRPKRRRLSIRMLLVFVLLLVFVITSALIGPQLWQGSGKIGSVPTGATLHPGSFVQLPLSVQQLNDIQHLPVHLRDKELASLYVSRMSLDEEIGQLIMVEYSDTYYSDDLNTMLTTLHAGGVIMYEFQMLTQAQTQHDIGLMQQNADLPLLVSTDEEGGPYVHRLLNIYPARMSATEIANTQDPAVATSEGHRVAHDLLSLGINVNLAPDVDVQLVAGIDQVSRTFGSTPEDVIKYAGPYMSAMQSDGVIATIKHFPGLGDATVDAHTNLPVINRTKDEIYNVELAPFKHFVQLPASALDHPGIVMPTDLLMPAIDPTLPAELSPTFITDILRKQFGYDGVVLTDALYMQGVQINGEPISMAQAGVMALQAGDDMLLGPDGVSQMEDMINGIKAALQNGTLSKARIDEAATRIITLKMDRHLMPAVPPQS